jgi:hypothetical protein
MSRSFLVVLGLIAVAVAVVMVSSWRAASPGMVGGLGDLRGFMSAEHAYASANGGYFDHPSCLAAPARCIPGYPAANPVFIDGALSRLEPALGYTFQFHSGPAPSPGDVERARASKSSLTAFALVALPLPGSSQRRAFCGDSSGRVCVGGEGTMPEVREGRCPDTCETLR